MMKNKNLATIIAVFALIVLFGLIVIKKDRSVKEGESVENETATSTEDVTVEVSSTAPIDVKVSTPVGVSVKSIVFDGKSFSPSVLKIKAGETVTFSNASKGEVWPASDLHPTHRDYPGSDIKKCGTSGASAIFDACKGLKAGESWSFKFGEVGAWTYHNHLQASEIGTIVVE